MTHMPRECFRFCAATLTVLCGVWSVVCGRVTWLGWSVVVPKGLGWRPPLELSAEVLGQAVSPKYSNQRYTQAFSCYTSKKSLHLKSGDVDSSQRLYETARKLVSTLILERVKGGGTTCG